MSEVPWSQYEKAYKAIHDKLAEVLAKLDNVSDPQLVDILAATVTDLKKVDLLAATVTDLKKIADIKTAGLKNIIIDKLEQDAQKPYRHWVMNDEEAASPSGMTIPHTGKGLIKYFARGMRGAILRFRICVMNYDLIDHVIKIRLGYEFDNWIKEFTITVPAETPWTWRMSAFIGETWDYDNMYVNITDTTAPDFDECFIGYDILPGFEDSDYYYWDGSHWRFRNYRLYFRMLMGTSVGDVPVAGVVRVPGVATETTLAKQPQIPTSLLAGQRTVTTHGTPVALGSGTLKHSVLIQPMPTNTDNILVGNSSDQYFLLTPTSEPIRIFAEDLGDIYIDAAVDGEGVNYVGG